MSSDDEGGLPVVPALLRAEGSAALDESDVAAPEGGPPEQLGFHLRFEGGRALLALENVAVAPGIEVKRALFEVPDVRFPLDVSGGATRFQDRRLTLRGVELALAHDTLFVPDRLRSSGLTLLRERTRPGGLELLVSVEGANGAVPVRARGLFVAAGDAGVAVVLHEIIPFGSAPRPRLELGQLLLDALALPGGSPARAMLRRAHPFRAVFSRLLPAYGWKVPALGGTTAVGEVRVHEVVLAKGQIVLRAWAGELPDGWKPPRRQKPGPLEEAVALALFADDLADAPDDKARLAVVDRLLDDGKAPAAVVPFAAELLRRDPRRRAEGDDLVDVALQDHPEHLGVLSAHVDAALIEAPERAQRLLALGRAADLADEPWVSARAYLVAAELAEAHGDKRGAKEAAEHAWNADPTHGPTGALFVRLAVEAGERGAALKVGRTALERLEEPQDAEILAVALAPIAHDLEGAEAARALLRRALRREDRTDALMALVRLEIADRKLDRAAETLTRLLAVEHADASLRADVHILAAELAEARDDLENARLHLGRAREARPSDARLAVRQAALHRRAGDLDRAVESLQRVVDDDPAPAEVLLAAAELRIARAAAGDGERALALLGRIEPAERTRAAARMEAEAKALLGDVVALATLLEEEATSGDDDDRLTAWARAAELYHHAGRLDDAARAIVSALSLGDAAAARMTAVLLAHDGVALARAVSSQLAARGAPAADARTLSAKLAGAGRPLDGHALLEHVSEPWAVAERASLARAAGDEALERDERLALVELLEGSALHENLCRLAALEREPDAAARAWSRAAPLGHVDVSAWLEAALASASAERISEVLRRRDAELGRIPAEALRRAVQGPWLDDAREIRVRVLEAVAEREGEVDDARAFLEEARTSLPPKVAAAAFARFAARHGRPPWLLVASELEVEAGDEHAALHRLLGALGSPLGEHAAVLEALLERALEQRHADGITRAALALYAFEDLEVERRLAALSRGAEALAALDEERWAVVAAALLDVEPAADDCLVPLVGRALRTGQRAVALARLGARLAATRPPPAAVLALLEATADDARAALAADDEISARELIVQALAPRADAGGEPAVRELERLADLYLERGDVGAAVASLQRRVQLGGEAGAVAACLLRIGDVEEARRHPEAAADALAGALACLPDDASTSQRLVALLEEMEAWGRLAEERRRRAARLPRGPERTAALVKLGDLLLEKLDQPREAERSWLRALRSTFSDAPLSRLLKRANDTGNHRLFVRAHLAAAVSRRGDNGSAAHAAEAGAALAALLARPSLAIPAYHFAAAQAEDPLPSLRALVELYRAVGDVEGGISVVDRIAELTTGHARALSFEMRADLLTLAGDPAGAEGARRAALHEDPSFRQAALALERSLRAEGRVRDAIDVRRQLADAAEGPAHRAQTYASLAASARDDLADLELAAELAREALAEQPRLVGVRLLRVDCLEGAERAREAAEELGWLLENADLPAQERVVLCRRKAGLEQERIGDLQAARSTLRRELARDPSVDVLAHEVAAVEEELGEPGDAAQALASCLSSHPDGTDALGNRREVLERIARLLEDAGDDETALAHLEEGAQLGRLSRDAELRRARVAEKLGSAAVAVTALSGLLAGEHGDAEETVALLGRLAVAAERAGDPAASLHAWRERAQRVPGDIESLLAVERLARLLGESEAARAATEHLVRLEVGPGGALYERFLWMGRDSSARLDDPAGAYRWLERAAAIAADRELLGEMLGCAEAAGDDAAQLDVLSRLEERGEALPANAVLRRAELKLDVSKDAESSLRAAREALRADGVDEQRAAALLVRVSELAGRAVLEALLEASDETAEARALRASLGPLARFTSAELARLADHLPFDEEAVSAAAEAEALDGDGVRACDRVLRLAASLDGRRDDAARAHKERAAELLLAADIDPSALLGRFDALKGALASEASRRQPALHLLRDAEAFGPVAELLETALAHARVEDRRPLRMELVAVLRSGLDDPGRAAAWLDAQVLEDPDDREAWGELLECLAELGDGERLVDALARRIARASGLERRELIRRRAELLLTLARGDEAIDDLTLARTEAPGDAALKALERRVHEAQGPGRLAAFLSSELRRDGDKPGLDDARALLALDPRAVAGEDRVVALIALGRASNDEAAEAARLALSSTLGVARRVAEALGAAVVLGGDRLDAFLAALAHDARALGARGALDLVDMLCDAGVPGVGRAFGLSSVGRRARLSGPAAALRELERLGPDDVPAQARAAAALALALKVGDLVLVRSRLASGDIRSDVSEFVEGMLDGTGAVAAAELEATAAAGIVAAAQGPQGLAGAVRLADARVVERRLGQGSATEARTAAARARHLRLTAARLPLRLALSAHLDDGGALELEQIAATARALGDARLAAEAVDALLASFGHTSSRASLRADLALELDEPGAELCCSRAADLAPTTDEKLRYRRAAVELVVRRGARPSDVDSALRGLVSTSPGDVAVVREAMRIAEAMQLHGLIEELLAAEASHAAGPAEQAAAVRRRSDQLRRRLRRPAAAFDVLLEAAAQLPAEGFAEEAYQLAAAEGLVEHQLVVVDDELAEAALLGLLGRLDEALAKARSLEGAAARLLEADLHAAAGDAASEVRALSALVEGGRADDGVHARLARRALDAGDADRALDAALTLAKTGRHAGALDVIARSLREVRGFELERALIELPAILDGVPASEPAAQRLVDAWAEAASAAGKPAEAGAALQRRAAMLGSDAAWVAWLRHALRAEPAAMAPEGMAAEVAAQLDRPAVIRALAGDVTLALAHALRAALPSHASAVVDCLSGLHDLAPLPSALQDVLVDALAVLGRHREAAELVLSREATSKRAVLARQYRAARLALTARAPELALDALQAVPLADVDDGARQLALAIAQHDPSCGALALVRIAAATGDRGDVSAALEAGFEAPGEVAAAVAGWRLESDPADVQAWKLAATRASPAARKFFGAALASVGEGRWPDPLGDDGARVRAIARREIAVEAPPKLDGSLARARGPDPAARRAAWRDLADHARDAGQPITAARLLSRAGVPLTEAPIEVRLAADAALAEPRARAEAVAAAVLENGAAHDGRGVHLRDELVALEKKGWLGARHRRALRRLSEQQPDGWADLIDGVEAHGVDCATVVAKLGRHPSLVDRSTAAALLASSGARDLARSLLPALFAERERPRADDVVAQLERRAAAAGEVGLLGEQLSLLRALTGMMGPRLEWERAIQAAATAERRFALVLESLWREHFITADAKARARLRLERARLLAEELGRPALALDEMRDAARLCADDEDVARLWVDVASRTGSATDEVEAIAALERLVARPEQRAELVLQRARLLREHLQAPGAALAALDATLAVVGERGDLLAERARCALSRGDRAQAAATFLRAASATQGGERDVLRAEAAKLFEALGDVERACEALERSAAEGDFDALERLEATARARDLPAPLARALEMRLNAATELEARRPLALELAQLLAERLDQRSDAIELLEQQAVRDERDFGARIALAEWYVQSQRVLDAALAYESAARIPDLPAAVVAPPAREAVALLAARGDLERAAGLAELVLANGDPDGDTLDVALQWHRASESWQRLDELLGVRLDLSHDARERARAWMERAKLRREHLDDAAGAKHALHRALEEAPDLEPALEEMRREANESDAWGALRAALSRAADVGDEVAQRVSWLREIAALDRDHFGDLRAADATLARAIELSADDGELLLDKARIMSRLGQMDGLAPLLERAVRAGAGDLPPDLLLHRGDALLLGGDIAEARRCFVDAAESASEEPLRNRAWDRLLDLIGGHGGHDELAQALTLARASTEDVVRQAELARRELRVRLEAGDRDGAAEAAQALLDAEPADSQAFEIVKADHVRRRRLDALVPRFEAWARAAGEKGERARRLSELGAFLLDEVGAEAPARRAFEEALAADESDGVARIRLASIAYGAQDWETALRLMDEVNPGLWPRGETALLLERAECAVKLGHPDADQRLREVLRQDPKHIGALELMARLARERHDDESVEFALERLAEAIDQRRDPERAAKVLTELAQLRAKQHRFSDAVVAADRARELAPSSLAALELVAELYEHAGKLEESAEAWRRVAGMRPAGQTTEPLERRARLLEAMQRLDAAAVAYVELYETAGIERFRDEAVRVARAGGLEEILDRLGVPRDEPTAETAIDLKEQIELALADADFDRAVTLAADGLRERPDDGVLETVALEAARAASDANLVLALCEERLQAGLDAVRVRQWALLAGRTARDKLRDMNRAAGLLYRAHQAAPEDVDIRLELTSLYAQIEDLVDAAQMGVEQLLRRAPTDARVYHLASDVAAAQHSLERARAMRAAEHLLLGRSSGLTTMPGLPLASPRVPVTVERLAAGIGPTGFGSAASRLVQLLAPELERALVARHTSVEGSRRLEDASPQAHAIVQRIDQLLPGRAVKLLVSSTTTPQALPGAHVSCVFPEDALLHGEAVLAAHVGRAFAVARLGGVLLELLPRSDDESLVGLLRAAFVEHDSGAPEVQAVLAGLDAVRRGHAEQLAAEAFREQTFDVNALRSASVRMADRVALLVSGSLPAALDSGPLPALYRMPLQEIAAEIGASTRALDLCRFAARPSTWVLRKELGLVG